MSRQSTKGTLALACRGVLWRHGAYPLVNLRGPHGIISRFLSHGKCPRPARQPSLRRGQLLYQACMKFQRFEFSWRAAFIGLYLPPDREKLSVTTIPLFALYFKRV